MDIFETHDSEDYVKNLELREKILNIPYEFSGNLQYLNFLKTIFENKIYLTHISKLDLFENIVRIKLNQYFAGRGFVTHKWKNE